MLAAIAAATVLVVPAPSLATSGGAVRHCGNAGTPEDLFLANITARGVSCPTARHFIVGINARHRDLGTRDTRYQGYLCRPTADGVASWVRCTRGPRVIRWLEGT